MSFFPVGFNPRADVVGALDLVNINTPDGDFGFLLGQDGKFTDVNDTVWWGTVLLTVPTVPFPINGVAPAGELAMTFFQDPDLPDLVGEIMDLGSDYIRGRAITFYVQVLTAMEQIYAPVVAPIRMAAFEMRSISATMMGPMQRRLTLSYEGVFAGRNEARGLYYSTVDHARLIGSANPSLNRIPTEYRPEEKLF